MQSPAFQTGGRRPSLTLAADGGIIFAIDFGGASTMSAKVLRALSAASAILAAAVCFFGVIHPHTALAGSTGCGGGSCVQAEPGCAGGNCVQAEQGCGGGNCLAPCDAHPCVFELVSDAEARLPDAPASRRLPGRGLIPGPDIIQVAPTPGASIAHAPFALRIAFKPHSDEPVDPASVQVLYDKNPEIDLTARLAKQKLVSADGIDIPHAMLPPGRHEITVLVADIDKHVEYKTLSIEVRGQ